MRKLLLTSTALAMLGVMTSAAQAEYFLTVLHFNDFHARFDSINKYDSNCNAEGEAEGTCFGGIARIKTAIDERRDALEGNNLLVLSAGDEFQGSLYYTTYKSQVVADFLNDLDLDAAATGNHEFDDGPAELAAYIDRVGHPILKGNFDVASEPALAGKMQDHIIIERGGEKIAIIGALATDTSETSAPGDNVKFLEPVEFLTGAVADLEKQGINKIILLSHLGLPGDRHVAENVVGIDLIVGGHSHTLLSNTNDRAEGPYPIMIGGTAIVQAYAFSKYLGEINLTFNDAGELTEAKGEPLLLDASIVPDQDMLDRLVELKGPIQEAMAKPVGNATANIDGSRETCRSMECPMGNLVTDAMLDATPEADFAITNGGGLRASIDAGEITMGEIFTVLPFQNTLATFDAKGSDIMAALENGVSQVEDGAGRFPQVSGMSYTWDAAAEPGSRITKVMVGDAPLDLNATYHVVTNNFVRAGGDGYSSFAENGMNAYDGGSNLEVVVADYIKARGQDYAPFVEGRIARMN